MRAGIVVNVTRADRLRLEAIVADRSAPQKHVWRAKVILATAEGRGTRPRIRVGFGSDLRIDLTNRATLLCLIQREIDDVPVSEDEDPDGVADRCIGAASQNDWIRCHPQE